MAHNPHAPQGQGPEGNHDPAGSTQMFRAFVDEAAPTGGSRRRAAAPRSGPKIGLILGVVGGVIVLAVVTWLAVR
ncbi:hypothetical protein ACFQ61_05180 [Streptomyces sp. NPDC056500]|uniref:hypothetical protein n=1 Tax=Streptomyces sp. NPDC056500 TaxID=3345840 RepID=UPI0036B80E73